MDRHLASASPAGPRAAPLGHSPSHPLPGAAAAGRARARCAGLAVLLMALAATASAAAGRVTVGKGAIWEAPQAGGLFSAADPRPPEARWRSGAALHEAAPTNSWYASLMFERWSHPLYAQPLSYRAGPQGFEVGHPGPEVQHARDGWATVNWAHRAALTIAPAAFQPDDARLAGHGDWHVDVAMAHGADSLRATILHGSPFSYYRLSRGDAVLHFAPQAQPRIVDGGRVVSLTVGADTWAVFLPPGAAPAVPAAGTLTLGLPDGARWFSLALLPDGGDATREAFRAHAYAFVTGTRASFVYDRARSEVETTFQVTTQALDGDPRATPIVGLYPHQVRRTQGLVLPYRYASVRGTIEAGALDRFVTRTPYGGIVPLWPALPAGGEGALRLPALLRGDVARTPDTFDAHGPGTYWVGKALGRAAQLLAIAQVEGRRDAADDLQRDIEDELTSYWKADGGERHFARDAALGTLLGYPEEFGSVSHMNDHHFHYGYWIQAAAMAGLRDPAFVRADAWGPVVDLLVDDIATDRRGLASAPFLRNFDVYEGHSWASGDATMDAGNNQESSSEAMNAWAGLIAWGSVTGRPALVDLGVSLYATEADAIREYWFDCHHEVFDAAYRRPLAAQVFGGKYAYDTWWTQNPREVQGINLLPMTPASTYLARCIDGPATLTALDGLQRRYRQSGADDGAPLDIWQDVFAEFRALWSPSAALSGWSDQGDVEVGESRTHAWYWLQSLGWMGAPDPSVRADTAWYAVFRDAAGARTYESVNAADAPSTVHFTDGRQLVVPPHSLGLLRVDADGHARSSSQSLLR